MNDVLLNQATEYLQKMNIPWAFCGGYALDLFLNRTIRKHSDIDVCVFEEDRDQIVNTMISNGWIVYQFLGQGKVRLLNTRRKSDPGRNLMCVKDGCSLVKFYPTDEKDVFWHEFFHTGIESLNYLEFLFNCAEGDQFIFNQNFNLTRAMENAVLHNDGCPYLAPELALLHKAANAENPEYQYDYEMTIPHLNDEQLKWFYNGLGTLYSQGHPWDMR